jgi:hypothetical protein
MQRVISALVLVAATAFCVAGCGGDDDDDTSSNGGSGGSGASSSQAGQPATSEGGGDTASSAGAPSNGNVACDASVDGVCQNATDCPFVVDGTARLTAGTCGQGCIGKAANCSRDCITMMLEMTSECASCYADTVNCTIANCLAECVGDPEADTCKQCQVDKGCRADFDACSGLPD